MVGRDNMYSILLFKLSVNKQFQRTVGILLEGAGGGGWVYG